jgi:hypothetical protein
LAIPVVITLYNSIIVGLSELAPARGFKMYLQYYINEKGDKVYTTKVCALLRLIFAD